MTAWTVGILLCSLTANVYSSAGAGPYYANVLGVGSCTAKELGEEHGEDIQIQGSFRHLPGVSHHVYTGNVTLRNNVGVKGNTEASMNVNLTGLSELSLTTFIAKWDSVSGWRNNFMVLRIGEICQAVNLYGPRHKAALEKYAGPLPSKCPFPNRSWTVSNMTSHYEPFPFFPIGFYGRFRMMSVFRSLIHRSAKPVACIRLEAELVEKVT